MISLINISVMRGQQLLLDDASLVVKNGQRVGVIGRNGSGKTSLFKAIAGEVPLESGAIEMPNGTRWSMMAQETPGVERSALEFVLDAHQEFRRLETAIAEANENQQDQKLASLLAEMDNINGYDIRYRAEQLLSGLGFSKAQFENTVGSFSGGWRVRLNLASALMCPAELLMLDEPTNHLDLEATVWLEQWLRRYDGTLLLISHDRTFLDSVTNQIVSLDARKLDSYKGNYSAYEKLRAEKMALQQAMFEKQQQRRAEIEDFVRRFRAKATKAKQAQSRLKELNRMQEIAPAHVDSPFHFQFFEMDYLPSVLLQVDNLAIGFDTPLLSKLNWSLLSESRIGLLGFNGSGKSTLLKVLSGQLAQLQGDLLPAKKLRVGYYAQHQVDELDMQATPLQELRAVDPKLSEQGARDVLGGFNFKGARVDEAITNFSGGEKARLALAKVVTGKPNLLLLDEPTNHLDLEMVHALTVALQEFQGALVIVSHDRHLLANTVNEFYSIHQGNFTPFDGDLSEYEKWLVKEYAPLDQGGAKETGNVDIVDKKKLRQDAAAKRASLAPLRKAANKIEKEIASIQQELEKIESSLADESIYNDENKRQLTELLQNQGQLKTAMSEKEEKWFELETEMEAAS
ncbi:MAG: ABC-F family ATP-binding cassette domain-containing protein [Pseudohongiellaceae bacterium]